MNAALLACLFAVVPQAEADFRSANERALEGDLAGAIELYGTLLARGIDDADVYYNLGNAYAEAGKPIDAILSYERALRRAPGDPEILENLRFVRRKLSGAKEESDPVSLTMADAIEPMIAPVPASWFGWIAGGANGLLFGAWFLRRRSASKRARRGLGTVVAFALGALIISIAVVAGHLIVARDPRGVVIQKAELREGPHAKFKVKAPAAYGGRVRVLDASDDFLEVLQEDGTSGWVPAKAITRV